MKRLVRHAENSNLLAECKAGLNHALEVFIVRISIS